MNQKKLKFPKDVLPHNKIIEWWYFNGHLKDSKGKRYAYMNCLFRADAKKSKIPGIKKAPVKNIYFVHSIFSDLNKKKIYYNIYPLALLSKDSFTKKRLFINYTFPSIDGYLNHELEEVDKFKYKLKTNHADLTLDTKKKPFLEGKKGFLNFGSKKSTYYYSLTNLDTKGYIQLKNKRIKVKGKSWMDHQWANSHYAENDKWNWFSIQLDNDIELVVFEYITNNKKHCFAGINYSNGKSSKTENVNIIPLDKRWKSKKTEATYPTSWKIEIPEKEIELITESLINQEVIFSAINYLENPIKIKGKIKNKKVKGRGFMELVGYPAKVSKLKVYEQGIRNVISDDVDILKKDIKKFFHLN